MTKIVIKFLASLKLAVVIMTVIAVIIAAGTIVESRYDSFVAKKWVYDTWFMLTALSMLAVCLTAVMADRWPWKKRHAPFVLAHIGILILLLGSLLTMKYGVDGSLRVPIGKKSESITINETELAVWSTFDGDNFTRLYNQSVDFFSNPPDKHEVQIQTDAGPIRITNYMPFALASRKIIASDDAYVGAGIRFQLKNAMTHFSDWVVQRKKGETETQNLGPAQIILGASSDSELSNRLVLTPLSDKKIKYQVFYKDPLRKTLTGELEEGGQVQTGWMGFEFQLLRYFPKAEETWEYQALDRPTPATTSSIEVEFQAKKHWLQQDDMLKLFTDKASYLVTYGQKRIPLGFTVELKDFEIGRYQGTMRAASYASHVAIPGFTEDKIISMNEPLNYKGYTLYQASFQDGPEGKPIASIFSVNHDPGRWLKYLGSLLISCGIVLLFYNRRKNARAQAPLAGAIE